MNCGLDASDGIELDTSGEFEGDADISMQSASEPWFMRCGQPRTSPVCSSQSSKKKTLKRF